MSDIGAAIKELRKTLGGISQERFAHQLGLTTRTISRWEHGDPIPVRALSHLRTVAITAGARAAADVFERKIREDLQWDLSFNHAICSYCGASFVRQRAPKTGQRNYCEDCARKNVPARLSQRDKRARERQTKPS